MVFLQNFLLSFLNYPLCIKLENSLLQLHFFKNTEKHIPTSLNTCVPIYIHFYLYTHPPPHFAFHYGLEPLLFLIAKGLGHCVFN